MTSKNILKGLSLSFYDQDTIRKNKQIICDGYDLTEELTSMTLQINKKKSSSKHQVVETRRSSKSKGK